MLSKIRPSFLVLSLLAAAAVTGTVVVACDETGPSPIGEHFDDASVEPEPEPEPDAGEDAGEDGGEEAGEDGGDAGETDGGDAGDGGDGGDAG